MREKLIELFAVTSLEFGEAVTLADYLIANGVTFATDNNVGSKWISVKDRLPEQGQEVIVYSGGVLKPTVFAYQFWNKDYDSWARITHWMPLPEAPTTCHMTREQPPKGE